MPDKKVTYKSGAILDQITEKNFSLIDKNYQNGTDYNSVLMTAAGETPVTDALYARLENNQTFLEEISRGTANNTIVLSEPSNPDESNRFYGIGDDFAMEIERNRIAREKYLKSLMENTNTETANASPTQSVTAFLTDQPPVAQDSELEISRVENNNNVLNSNQFNTTQNTQLTPAQLSDPIFMANYVSQNSNETNQINRTDQMINNISATNTDVSNNNLSKTDGSRVETNQIVSKNEINKITKPVNPVAVSVDNMNQTVSRNLEGVREEVKNSFSNISTSGTTNNSTTNQFDQSQITTNTTQNQMVGETEGKKDQQVIPVGQGLNDFYLASIYEMLATGIKVKITY